MSAAVERAGHRGSAAFVDVIVTFDGLPNDHAAATAGAQITRRFQRLPMQAMRVPIARLDALARHPLVTFVSLDSEVAGASLSAKQTMRVPEWVTDTSPNTNYTGDGVRVAVLDTGVAAHSDLAYRVQAQHDFVNGQNGESGTDFVDPYGHGTQVAGVISGSGRYSQGRMYEGVSNADVVSLRVLDGEGRGQTSDVIAALDWILAVGQSQYQIRVVNLSLGKAVEEAQHLDPLVQAVNRVWDAGVVVVSAGNYGSFGAGTVTSPGNSRKVITVGSLTDNGTGDNVADDYVSTYSSHGPTAYDYVLKPDLLAPGNRFIAPLAPQSMPEGLLPGNVISGRYYRKYLSLSGTSMAAPAVSATAARMLDKNPSLTPATVKARLMKSARKIDGDPTATGAGVLDVDSALSATGTVTGDALSPRLQRSDDGTRIYVEDTAQLWGGTDWAADFLWSDGYLWSDGFLWSDHVGSTSIDVTDP
jgi:serine protease AprX